MAGKLRHHSSAFETKDVKIDKKNFFRDALQYIEQHVAQSGFKVLNAVSETGGITYFLIKE